MIFKKTIYQYGDGSKPWYLVNPKIAGKWMFIPLKMVLIGIDPYPYIMGNITGTRNYAGEFPVPCSRIRRQPRSK
jgi:hypothetical protein